MMKGNKLGSKPSEPEKFVATSPAPDYLQTPDRVARMKASRNRQDWQRERRADARDAARREDDT